jgi:mycothiol S-conjugate amidase
MVKAGLDSPFTAWLERASRRGQRAAPVTTRVDVGDYYPQRDASLRAHATQIDPDGFFFAVPRDLERAVWPWDEYELAHSTVPVDFPETDLFAGLR